jgi:hypothetical protein
MTTVAYLAAWVGAGVGARLVLQFWGLVWRFIGSMVESF